MMLLKLLKRPVLDWFVPPRAEVIDDVNDDAGDEFIVRKINFMEVINFMAFITMYL